MFPEDQPTKEVFEFYIDKCAFFKVEWKIHILFFRYDADYDYALFPLSWAFYDISHALWNAKSMCIFRRNVHFVHEKYNECYKMGWLGKIIWKYRDMELSLHQFKKRILTGWYNKSWWVDKFHFVNGGSELYHPKNKGFRNTCEDWNEAGLKNAWLPLGILNCFRHICDTKCMRNVLRYAKMRRG